MNRPTRVRGVCARFAALMLLAGPLLATAAADTAGADTGGSGGGCRNDPGVSNDTIKVGALLPTSGPQAQSFGASLDGIQARFDQANADGELGDRQIDLVVADDAGDTARNLTGAQQLVEQDDVFGVVELSSAADGSAAYLNEEKIPVTGWHVGVGAWGKYKNMFGWRNSQPPDPRETFTTRQADVLKVLGAKKIAMVGANLQASATFIDQLDEAIGKTKGLEVVYKTTDVTPADREFTGIADQIKDSGADGFYIGMDFVQNAALSAALNQADVEMKAIVFPGGYDKRAAGIAGLEGVYFGIEFEPFELESPAFLAYREAMQAAGKAFEGQVAYNGWLSAEAFVQGLKEAGVACPTRAKFIKNLRNLKGYDANGAFLPVDFGDIFGRTYYCVYYVQVQNAAFVPQFDGKPFCATRVIDDGKVTKLKPAVAAKG